MGGSFSFFWEWPFEDGWQFLLVQLIKRSGIQSSLFSSLA